MNPAKKFLYCAILALMTASLTLVTSNSVQVERDTSVTQARSDGRASAALSTSDLRRHLVEQVQAHVELIRQFPCWKPQPYIVRAEEVVTKQFKNFSSTSTLLFVPHHTVLMRCGEYTGCCTSPSEICTPKVTEITPVVFRVATVLPNTEDSFLTVEVENHRECHCVRSLLPPPHLRNTSLTG